MVAFGSWRRAFFSDSPRPAYFLNSTVQKRKQVKTSPAEVNVSTWGISQGANSLMILLIRDLAPCDLHRQSTGGQVSNKTANHLLALLKPEIGPERPFQHAAEILHTPKSTDIVIALPSFLPRTRFLEREPAPFPVREDRLDTPCRFAFEQAPAERQPAGQIKLASDRFRVADYGGAVIPHRIASVDQARENPQLIFLACFHDVISVRNASRTMDRTAALWVPWPALASL